MTNEQRMAGNDGCYLVSDTSAITSGTTGVGLRELLVVQEDTVIATLTAYDGASNYSVVTRSALASKTLKQGAIITVPAGHRIIAITLTSGSVILY
jgi:hypothetical protein